MLDEVRMAKSSKYRISHKAELGNGTGQYGMILEDDHADDDPKEGVPLDNPGIVAPVFSEANPVPVVPPLVSHINN